MSTRLRCRAAFTLVELLVVIGIIALLVSILLPALGRAREQARRVQCASNLRQIVVGYTNYATDSKGWYPMSGWEGAPAAADFWLWQVSMTDFFVPRYLKQPNVLFCPGQAEMFPEWRSQWYDKVYQNNWRGTSYLSFTTWIMDQTLDMTKDPHGFGTHYQGRGWRVRKMGEKSPEGRKMLLADIVRRGPDFPVNSGVNGWWFTGHWKAGTPQGGNIGYTDGSVVWKPYSNMTEIPAVRTTGMYTWSIVHMWW
jgi:prepilin-type N-terminal cleavage/methylation domain-containing protein